MPDTAAAASIPEVTHHHTLLNDTDLHYVSAGSDGTPVLLVHGFPETWWAFHKLIPLLGGWCFSGLGEGASGARPDVCL